MASDEDRETVVGPAYADPMGRRHFLQLIGGLAASLPWLALPRFAESKPVQRPVAPLPATSPKHVLWYGTPEAIKDMVTQSGAERINELTAQGRSVILLAPHFIGLDAAATRLTMEVPSAATMYTPQSDPHIDAVVA